MVEMLSVSPAELLGLKRRIRVGAPANLVLFSPDQEWVLNEETNLSKSQNTPLWEKTLKGRIAMTLKDGKIVYKSGA